MASGRVLCLVMPFLASASFLSAMILGAKGAIYGVPYASMETKYERSRSMDKIMPKIPIIPPTNASRSLSSVSKSVLSGNV